MQRSGNVLVAGASTADVITVLGTGNPVAGRLARAAHPETGVTGPLLIDVEVVAKPWHWPSETPSTQLGPCVCVGAVEFCWQIRLPPTVTRLTSGAVGPRFCWISTLPLTLPSHARQDAPFDEFPWHWKLPL